MIEFLLYPLVFAAGALRLFLTSRRSTYLLVALPGMQRLLSRMGIIRAYQVYRHARRHCPAYRDFLAAHNAPLLKFGEALDGLPMTDKDNYVRKYTIEERCYGGRLPQSGVVIDESSGSSGVPNNWVRGPEDRSDIKKLLQFTFSLTYREKNVFLINCFALGPWATGMNVSMSLVDIAVMKSLGPDIQKLENTLKTFGKDYQYLITGYPPFIRSFLAQTTLDLGGYKLWLVTGGEGISEGLRQHFLKTFSSVYSSYGASDLDINIGAETELTVRLRSLCNTDKVLTKRLFGQDRLPMIFQFNPLDYYIETTAQNNLIFTVNRRQSAAPKIRYNLKDIGGVLSYQHLKTILRDSGAALAFPARHACLPLLFVYGRDDTAVPFYGCKIIASDIDHVIYNTPDIAGRFASFKFSAVENERFEHHLKIILECNKGVEPSSAQYVQSVFFNELKKINQDFREVSKLFTQDQIIVEQHGFQQGPFHNQDMRTKLNYIQKD